MTGLGSATKSQLHVTDHLDIPNLQSGALFPGRKWVEGQEKVGLIHLSDELLAKSPESGLLSDWL